MAELNREGHRQRVKTAYLNNAFDSMPDHNVLEMLLFYSIPRVDVKPIAYELINHFGSIENVFNASVSELTKVRGVGENTAILINLVKDINSRVAIRQNENIKTLDSYKSASMYVENLLKNQRVEKMLVVTLNNDLSVINHHFVAEGTVNHASIEPIKIIEHAISDRASSVILAHNHPNGNASPSMEDRSFTVELLGLLRKLNIKLNDHIIVGRNESLSMSMDPTCRNFFK